MLSIDARDAEGRYVLEPAHEQTAERQFERNWRWPSWKGSWLGSVPSTSAPAAGRCSRR